MQPSIAFILLAILAGLIVLAAAGHLILRPRMLHWGAAPNEAEAILGGDELISGPIMTTTRAISIKAEPEKVWPWLAQMGQGRGGFYSYDWLENLAGMNIHNVQQIMPELQNLRTGDLIPFWRGAGVNVVVVEPPRLLVLGGTFNKPQGETGVDESTGGTWVFRLNETEAKGTRLVVRSRVAAFKPAWLSAVFMFLLEPMHFIMERKMMLRIKELAERG